MVKTVSGALIFVGNFITEESTGWSKGFEFVEMSSAIGVLNAKRAVAGKDFEARNLNVNEAGPRERRFQRSTGSSG